MQLYWNNQSAIRLAKIPVFKKEPNTCMCITTSAVKKDYKEKCTCANDDRDQIANLFNKGLGTAKFDELQSQLGMTTKEELKKESQC